jgi:hypothetical protein
VEEINDLAVSTACNFEVEMRLKSVLAIHKKLSSKDMARGNAVMDLPTYSLIFWLTTGKFCNQ